MEACKHEFGTKSRGNELYCPVCRGTLTKDDFDDRARPGDDWFKHIEEKTITQQYIEDAYAQGYRVTDDGKVISPTGKQRKIAKTKSQKYPTLPVRVGERPRKVYGLPLHTFAAYCFYRRHPGKGLVVRHLDGDVFNIRKDNIVIGTYSENELDKPKEVRVRSAKIARAAQG